MNSKKLLKKIFLCLPIVLSVAACDAFDFATDDISEQEKEDQENKEDNKPEQKEDDKKESDGAVWNVDLTKYGVDFRNSLGSLISAKVKTSTTYKNCLNIGKSAAAIGAKFVPFYHGSDYTVSNDVSCNREHTWPNSRGGGDKNGGTNIESDPFMIRPTITQDNSDRGNNFYGIPGSKLNGTSYSNQWDPASCGFESARGESARIIFYVATKYGESNGLKLSNNPSDATSERSMGTLKYLVQWNKQYPVTDMEIQINNYLYSQGYGRNPFVDNPNYVDYIWNENGYVSSTPIVQSTQTAIIQDNDYTIYDAFKDIQKVSKIIF